MRTMLAVGMAIVLAACGPADEHFDVQGLTEECGPMPACLYPGWAWTCDGGRRMSSGQCFYTCVACVEGSTRAWTAWYDMIDGVPMCGGALDTSHETTACTK